LTPSHERWHGRGVDIAIRREVEHLIHNKDGTIGQRNSYGPDSRRRKG
jgi:hypothetical protein